MKKKKMLSLLTALWVVLGLAFIPAQSILAEANESVLEARKGVLQVAAAVAVDGEEQVYTHVGTGFLVGGEDGAQTVITNYHVAHSLTEEIARSTFQIPAERKVEITLSVVVRRDVRINASIVNESAQADFSILRLEQPIYDRAPLKLADSDTVTTTQEVYALGFPGIVQDIQNDGVYTSDDVTVTSGIVSKTSDVVLADSPIECITHSAQVTYGNSGGPLVDRNGNVIGINTMMSTEDGNHDYFFSTKINEIRQVMDALGIEYISAGEDIAPEPSTEATEPSSEETDPSPEETEPAPGPTQAETEPAAESKLRSRLGQAIEDAEKRDLENMTEDSVENFQAALEEAKEVYEDEGASESEIEDALETLEEASEGLLEKTGLSTNQIILIAGGAAAAILVIVILIVAVSSSKKKKARAAQEKQKKAKMDPANRSMSGMGGQPMGGQPMGGRPPVGGPENWMHNSRQGMPPVGPASYTAGDDSMPTSVLNEGAGETTLLSGGASLPTAYLVRSQNNERVVINKQVFRIGKERRKVDYCISDNTNVSRVHADILYKNNEFYLVDDNTTNGTTINGTSLTGGREYILKNGDVIKMADEEFRFQK